MKRKFTKFLAVGLSLTMLLSACGTPEETAETGETAETAETAAAEAAEGETEGEAVEINYYSMWNEAESQGVVIKEAVADYEAATGNTVNITWVGRDIQKTIRATLDSGEDVDVWDQDIVSQIQQNGEYMLDLTPYYSQTYDVLEGKTPTDVISTSLIGLTKDLSGGQMKAVPYQPYAIVFMYNMEHFEKAGITETPKTWDEFLVVCQKLKDAGFVPLTQDDAYRDLTLGYGLARKKGYEWVEQLMNDKTLWSDPAVLEMAKGFETLAANGYFDESASSNVWPAGQTEFAMGNVSMYLSGTWLPNELIPQTGPDYQWGAFNVPAVKDGAAPQTTAMYGSQAFFINKNSENPDETMEFLATMVSPMYDEKMSTVTNGIPISSELPWPVMMENIKPAYGEITGWLPYGGGLNANADTKTVAMSEFARLIGGDITAEEFVANMSK